MSVRGIFTSDANIEGTRQKDFAGSILQIMPQGTAPLLALTSGMKKTKARDTVVNWFEENYLSGRVTCSTNMGAGTTDLVFSDVTQIVPGQILLIEDSSEHVFVTAVNTGTKTATVIRGYGGSTAMAKDGSSTPFGVQRLGSAHEEASERPVAFANRGYPLFNAVQTFRNSWDVSKLAQQLTYRTGPIKAKAMRDCAMEHANDMERSFIWGRYGYGTKNGNIFFTMNGIRHQLKTNVTTGVGATTYVKLRTFLQKVFERNVKGYPNERIAFCGNSIINALDDIARAESEINIQVGQTDFGFRVRRLITPYGEISLMTHPMFVENPKWTKDMLVLHPGVMETRWLREQDRDDYDKDGTRAGKDADYGVMTSDVTVCYKAEATGGFYSGVTGGESG